MEITPVSYVTITLFSTEGDNELADFRDFVKRAYDESRRAGLKNIFEKDRVIIKKLMEGLNIKVNADGFIINASDTHTIQQFNEY